MTFEMMKNLAPAEKTGLSEKAADGTIHEINNEDYQLVETENGQYWALGTSEPKGQLLFDKNFNLLQENK